VPCEQGDALAQDGPCDQGDALAQVVIPAKAGSQDDVGPRQRHAGMTEEAARERA